MFTLRLHLNMKMISGNHSMSNLIKYSILILGLSIGPLFSDIANAAPHGSLKWASLFQPRGWDPAIQPNTSYTQLVFESLLQTAADGETIEPALAEKWNLAPDKAEFRLRKGVVFHDGAPFNADAVIANLKHAMEGSSPWSYALDGISEIRKIDDYNIVIKLKTPNPTLPYYFTQQGLAMISPNALADGTWKTHPVGTGPYIFDESTSISGSKFVFRYFTQYYAPEDIVGPERVEILYIPDSTARFNALLAGQVDAVDGQAAQMARAKAAGFANHPWRTMRYHLMFLDRTGPLSDVRIRKALCLALPLKQINQARYGANGFPLPSQRFSKSDPSHVHGLKPYSYDIESAKALVKEAGGVKLEYRFPSAQFMRETTELIRESFSKIGANLDVITMPAGEYLGSFYSGKFPLWFSMKLPENGGMFPYYKFRFSKDGKGNLAHTEPPAALEKLYQEALYASGEKQTLLLKGMTQLIHDEALDCGYFDVLGVIHYNPKRFKGIVTTTWEPSTIRFKASRLAD